MPATGTAAVAAQVQPLYPAKRKPTSSKKTKKGEKPNRSG